MGRSDNGDTGLACPDSHVVVNGRKDRDWLACDIDACEDRGSFGDTWESLRQKLRGQVVEVKVDVVSVGSDATSLHDLDGHRARDDVAAREILSGRRVAFHEALSLRILENAAFAAAALRDQAAGALRELQVSDMTAKVSVMQ